ncbi:MAG: response regulator [Clostridiales bacterium]|jgi:two-component system response regulator YesN|nr:response regulator [Clostridiales bacterium]
MRLLVVDDEFFVRERIIRQLNWSDLGIDDVRQAANGTEAVSLMREYFPDILLTDVRMPNMDGLQLAEEIIRLKPECKLIFISGFSDAAYLRSAIRLRAVNYVEKPIDMGELSESIRTAANDLRRERFVENDLEQLKKKTLQTQLASVARGLSQRDAFPGAFQSLRQLLNDMDSFSYYVTVVAKLIGVTENNEQSAAGSDFLTFAKDQFSEDDAAALISDVFNGEALCAGFLKNDRIVMHLFCRSAAFRRREKLEEYLQALTNRLSIRGIGAVYAVGTPGATPHVFPDSYISAWQALSQCYYKSRGCVCYYRDYDRGHYDLERIPLSDFSHALNKETPHSLISMLNSLTAAIKFYDATPPDLVIRFYYTIVVLLVRAAEKDNIIIFEDFEDEYSVWDFLHRLPFLDDLNAFVIDAVNRYYVQLRSGSTNAVVNKIVRYIRQNYHDPDLSITMIADSMRLSPTYICHLFKNVMGVTLGSYLTQIRINEARELIEQGEYRVKEIAQKVGFRNGNYFSYKFKKEMGYSPSGVKN